MRLSVCLHSMCIYRKKRKTVRETVKRALHDFEMVLKTQRPFVEAAADGDDGATIVLFSDILH